MRREKRGLDWGLSCLVMTICWLLLLGDPGFSGLWNSRPDTVPGKAGAHSGFGAPTATAGFQNRAGAAGDDAGHAKPPASPGLAYAQDYNLPDTGQTKCYDNDKVIPCPQPGQAFYGQDGNYQGPQPAYTNNGDGTVTDLNTRLMWQRGDNQNQSGRTWQEAIDYCSSLGLAGHGDWRLPTDVELMSIVSYGTHDPAIDTRYFPNCRSDGYYSSSTNAGGPDAAWAVYFATGTVANHNKRNDLPVRCVRTGP